MRKLGHVMNSDLKSVVFFACFPSFVQPTLPRSAVLPVSSRTGRSMVSGGLKNALIVKGVQRVGALAKLHPVELHLLTRRRLEMHYRIRRRNRA